MGWQITYAATTTEDSFTARKKHFFHAKEEIKNMLEGKQPLSYERAIFLMENAYHENQYDYQKFAGVLDLLTGTISAIAKRNNRADEFTFTSDWVETGEMKKEKYIEALNNYAIYSFITDTTFSLLRDTGNYYLLQHNPYRYEINDPMGSYDWKNTQVLNLLAGIDKSGNCFALASLFKIFSERLNTNANLCTAPGHIYIRHADDKGIYHNVELASGSFPGTGSVKTLTYTTDEALKNQISLCTLDLKQSISLCLVYLAKGYQHKFNVAHDEFMKDCADLALQYDPLNLNALLLKAEIAEIELLKKGKTAQQLRADKSFIEYEQQITRLFDLGYREMPLEMKNIIIASAKKEMLPMITTNHTPQPFKSIGVTDTKYATLSWGLFDEMHQTKPLEQYGRTIFDTKKKRITGFQNQEPLYNNYNFDPVVFAWNIDPLAAKYPDMSPYAFVGNMPIIAIDPDGKRIYIVVEVAEEKDGKMETVKKVYDVIIDRKILESIAPTLIDEYDIARSTATGKKTLKRYEKSTKDDVYIGMMSFEGTTESAASASTSYDVPINDNNMIAPKHNDAPGKEDELMRPYEKLFEGIVVDPNKKIHLVNLNSLLNDDLIREIFGSGNTAETILHEVKFHIEYANQGITAQKQHDKAFGTTVDKHKDDAGNAVEGSPQKKIEKEVQKAVKK